MEDVDLTPIEGLVLKLRALEGSSAAIAAEARAGVEDAARKTAAAGTDPLGAAWAPTKTGRSALPNAASAISSVVSGLTVAVITLIMPLAYRFHQGSKSNGKRGLPRRVILPNEDTGLPSSFRDAIEAAARKVTARALGGGS